MSVRCLILGATGYVGSALCKHLDTLPEFEVQGVDTQWFKSGRQPMRFLTGDYRDFCDARHLREFDAIVLLAGHSSVPMCVKAPYDSWSNNVTNFISLLRCLEDQPLLYASSAGVYGKGAPSGATEDWEGFVPTNLYDLEKWVIDQAALLSGKRTYGLRFGTVCGPSPNLRTDLVLNRMTLDALEEKKVRVWNPWAFRPILGIQDLCRAVEALLRGSDTVPAGIYNLASFNASMFALSQSVLGEVEDAQLEGVEPRPSYDMTLSTEKFRQAFGFSFYDTAYTIVRDLLAHAPYEHTGDRQKGRLYV